MATYLRFRYGFRYTLKNDDRELLWKLPFCLAELQTTSPFDAHPVPAARVRCSAFMFILSRSRKNEPRKRTKGCRLWKLLLCCASKQAEEKDIFDLMYLSPLCHHARQTKITTEFCLISPLERALMRPRGRILAKQKAPTALEKPSGGRGFQGGTPWCPFFAYSLRQGKE